MTILNMTIDFLLTVLLYYSLFANLYATDFHIMASASL